MILLMNFEKRECKKVEKQKFLWRHKFSLAPEGLKIKITSTIEYKKIFQKQ